MPTMMHHNKAVLHLRSKKQYPPQNQPAKARNKNNQRV